MIRPDAEIAPTARASTITVEAARDLDLRIRDCRDHLYELLLEVHECRSWEPLGFDTFAGYLVSLGMTRQQGYRILDQGKVIRAISAAVSPMGDTPSIIVSEREARDIKPRLDEVVETIRVRTAEAGSGNVAAVVQTVVANARVVAQEDERRAKSRLARQWAARHPPPQPTSPAKQGDSPGESTEYALVSLMPRLSCQQLARVVDDLDLSTIGDKLAADIDLGAERLITQLQRIREQLAQRAGAGR